MAAPSPAGDAPPARGGRGGWTIQRTAAAALGAGLFAVAGVSTAAFLSMDRLLDASAEVARSERVLRELNGLYTLIVEAETGTRGYVLTGNPALLARLAAAHSSVAARMPTLRALANPYPAERTAVDALGPLATRRLALLDATAAQRRTAGLQPALAALASERGQVLMDSVQGVVEVLQRAQEARLAERTLSERAWVRGATTTVVAGLLAALVVGAAAVVGARRDLAAIGAAQQAAREAQARAEAANREKSEFLARMSHELRTPLNSVLGFSNLLLRRRGEALGPQGRTWVERVRDNGMHLLRLIDDLLDVARIEVGRIRIERRPVALDALVREVMAGGFEDEARGRGLTLTVDLPAEPVPFETDPARLRQVLVNLVSNALKFTERGGVTVRLVVDPGTGAPQSLAVTDTGVGIPADRQQLVFEAFEQTEVGRERGGTGLGLAICKALCDLLGYELELTSAEGVGSTFRVVFARRGAARRIEAPDPA